MVEGYGVEGSTQVRQRGARLVAAGLLSVP
jgi:hypothetical protein